ncbi:MAG TPA: hypothetical protein PKY56_07320 [Candidatus Kapabacteria bacterium]|nr:hypothetical protein [Candidatus Kapabacteria bacterium]HPO62049.1 hypothetical protein [Candidatus Kapabacteria bacterium]
MKRINIKNMNLVKHYTVLIALMFFCIITKTTKAQEFLSDSVVQEIKDTLCFKLDFKPGQKLTYRVESFDSIAIDYGAPLLKNRIELWEISCDSITSQGNFFLSQKLVEFNSIEATKDEEKVERLESPWLNKRVGIEIDSLGNRLSVIYIDTVSPALAPGGAFQPYILFKIGESLKSINESWITESTDTLVENGFPPAILNQISLNRVKGRIDTLDFNCNRFDYIKTAQGSVETVYGNGSFFTTVVVNSHGIMDISSKHFFPVHYYSTIEQKLIMHYSDSQKIKGWHYITTNFTLEKNENKEVIKPPKKIKNGKKQPSKRR